MAKKARLDNVYLPDLDKCFSGEAQIISWSQVFRQLTEDQHHTLDSRSISFLQSSEAQQLLSTTVPSFPKPSSESRTRFTAKTAAINSTVTSSASHNIEEIKDDALCLSKRAELDEVEALRIVLLEWQQRPGKRLRDGFSEAELASLRTLQSSDDIQGVDFIGENGWRQHDSPNHFESNSQRQSRQIVIYFEESTSLAGVLRAILENSLKNSKDQHNVTDGINLSEITASMMKSSSCRTANSTILTYIQSFQSEQDSLSRLESLILQDYDGDRSLYDVCIQENFRRTIIIMELMLLNLYSDYTIPSAELVLAWLDVVNPVAFFLNFEPLSAAQTSLLVTLQSLSAITTLAMLGPMQTIASITADTHSQLPSVDEKPYSLDVEGIARLNRLFVSLVEHCITPAGPAAFAWVLIVHAIMEQATIAKERRESQQEQRVFDQTTNHEVNTGRRLSGSSISSAQQSIYEDLADSIHTSTTVEDVVEVMMQTTLGQLQVFDIISTLTELPLNCGAVTKSIVVRNLQDLIFVALSLLGYLQEAVSAQLSILSATGNTFDELANQEINLTFDNKKAFLSQNVGQILLDTAISRFPYESLPMLRLCEALATAEVCVDDNVPEITSRLRHMKYYTQSVTHAFSAYQTIREEEDRNWVTLEQDVNMLHPTNQKLLTGANVNGSPNLVVPAGTLGRMISEEQPFVVTWSVEYSALAYLGAWLDTYRYYDDHSTVSEFEPPDTVASATIDLFTVVLSKALQHEVSNGIPDVEQAKMLIEEMSTEFSSETDLIAIIFNILEQELRNLRLVNHEAEGFHVVISCMRFLRLALKIVPDRVWSVISRSNIIDLRGSSASALVNLAAVESAYLDYHIFKELALLYDAVIESSLKQISDRKLVTWSSRVVAIQNNFNDTLPERIMQDTLFAFTQNMVEVFVVSSKWRVDTGRLKSDIQGLLCQTFEKIIKYTYSIDDDPDLRKKITKSLASSAEYLVETFLTVPGDVTSTEPILQLLITEMEMADSSAFNQSQFSITLPSRMALTMALILLRTRRALKRAHTGLEQQLLNGMPILIRLALGQKTCRVPSLEVIRFLVENTSDSQGTSLLGTLGSSSIRCFLEELSSLGRFSEDEEVIISVWNLVSGFLNSQQQFVAILLLTGSSPERLTRTEKDSSSEKLSSTMRGKTFLEEALDRLSNNSQSEPRKMSAMLGFIVQAQKNWSWSARNIQAHPDFLSSIVSYVSNHKNDEKDPLRESYHNTNTALILEICTMYLHHARAARDSAGIKTMVPMMTWLTRNVPDVGGYNLSLHSNLRKNFSTRYSPLTLLNFKRTSVADPQLGERYAYDIEIADKILSPDQAWTRPGSRLDKTFSNEFCLANLNLSLVDSQVHLLDSFKVFCVEHCSYFVQDRDTQKTMCHIAHNCLRANTSGLPSEKFFDTVLQTRAEFSLALMQSLVHVKARGSDFVALLPVAWEMLRFKNPTYAYAITNNDLEYFRTCLIIVLLALQFHITKRVRSKQGNSKDDVSSVQSDPMSPLVIEIAKTILAEGFSTVASSVNEPEWKNQMENSPNIQDLSILLSILQAVFRLPSLPQITTQLSECFISSDVVQSCLTLYSWSHIEVASSSDTDSPFGILALQFLVSLSSLPPLAEALAVDGVLNRLSLVRMTQSLMSCHEGASQFDKRPHCRTLYVVWASGILPLCLNLLHSVGRAMAGEISGFLNQFRNQLSLASQTFAKGDISLQMTEEAATLALISHILASYQQAGASAGVDSHEISPLYGYDESKSALIEDIEDLVKEKGVLKGRLVVTNEKEAAWQRSKEGDMLEQKMLNALCSALTCLKWNREESK